MEVGRLRCGKGFQGKGSNFECDALFDGEPVKSTEGRGNVIAPLVVGKDSASQRVLNGLEAVERSVWETVEQGITIVETGRNEGVGKGNSRFGVEEGSNLSEGAKLEEGGLTNSGYVAGEGMVGVEGHAEVKGRCGRRDSVIAKRDGGVGDLGPLLRSADDKEFSYYDDYKDIFT